MESLDGFGKVVNASVDKTEDKTEKREEQLVHVRAPLISEEKELEAPIPKRTLLPKTSSEVCLEKAKTFLEKQLPWGEKGEEFIERIFELQGKEEDIPFTCIYQSTEKCRQDFVNPKDLREALGEAQQCGILISGHSQGYSSESFGESVVHDVYRVNDFSLIKNLVFDAMETPLYHGIIEEEFCRRPFVFSHVPLRKDLSAGEFYSFFDKQRSFSDIIYNPSFYEGENVQEGPHVIQYIEARLKVAVDAGLLATSIQGSGESIYVLSRAGESKLQELCSNIS